MSNYLIATAVKLLIIVETETKTVENGGEFKV
ncbi:protein of unknown function [Thermococcus nautili]|nr:protein of unknown function [Thermococcus nautili]